MPDEVAALRAENGRLREANERLRMLLEDKDAKIADLEERIAGLEQLISRNSGTHRCRRARPRSRWPQQARSGLLADA